MEEAVPTKTPLTPLERAERDAAEVNRNGAARDNAEGLSKTNRNRSTHGLAGQAAFDSDDRGTPNYIGSR